MGNLSPNLLVLFAWVFASPVFADSRVQIEFAQNIAQFTDGRIVARNLSTQFDCGERIHAVFRLEDLEIGSRQIHTQWKSPGGKVERVNKREIRIASPQQVVFLSSSIEFDSGTPLSSLFDPAAGFEHYIGRWTVVVIVDNKVIESGHFHVLC